MLVKTCWDARRASKAEQMYSKSLGLLQTITVRIDIFHLKNGNYILM